jgi:hypothetical protein
MHIAWSGRFVPTTVTFCGKFRCQQSGWHEGCRAARLVPVSDSAFFSDRTGEPVPRVGEEITANAWRGLVALIQGRIGDGSLARDFPMRDCADGASYVTGTDEEIFIDSLKAHVPQVGDIPLAASRRPSTAVVLDILDFVALHIDQPSGRSFHRYFGHEHLFFSYNQEWMTPGEVQFRTDVDLILARNGIAFSFGDDMRIHRLGPPEARQLISDFRPETGDPELDAKLMSAVSRFQSRVPADRQDALEKLWDAFERLKTLEPGANKKVSVAKLLDRSVATVPFRAELESEFKTLTDIGNKFTIRHHEHDRYDLPNNYARDYLFIRLVGLIAFVLRQTGRMGP